MGSYFRFRQPVSEPRWAHTSASGNLCECTISNVRAITPHVQTSTATHIILTILFSIGNRLPDSGHTRNPLMTCMSISRLCIASTKSLSARSCVSNSAGVFFKPIASAAIQTAFHSRVGSIDLINSELHSVSTTSSSSTSNRSGYPVVTSFAGHFKELCERTRIGARVVTINETENEEVDCVVLGSLRS
jgi:hypothetical protein